MKPGKVNIHQAKTHLSRLIEEVASGNEVLIVLMEAISEPIYDAADYKEVTTKRIREETVKAHVRNILAKLGANDRTHAVSIAFRRGIIEL